MTECCPQPASPRTPEQQAAHEKTMERIRKALGPALTDAPRLPCGCLDYPAEYVRFAPPKRSFFARLFE